MNLLLILTEMKGDVTQSRTEKRIHFAWIVVIDVLIAALLFFAFSLYFVFLETDEDEAKALPTPSAITSVKPTSTSAPPKLRCCFAACGGSLKTR